MPQPGCIPARKLMARARRHGVTWRRHERGCRRRCRPSPCPGTRAVPGGTRTQLPAKRRGRNVAGEPVTASLCSWPELPEHSQWR
eukprot:2110415-Rhodomonas_salina.1